MNKLTKFLAFAGLTSAAAYVAFGLKGKPVANKVQKTPGNPSRSNVATHAENNTMTPKRPPSQPVTGHSNVNTPKPNKNWNDGNQKTPV